jgi:transcriptional regulator with XRE-family HTH domain
VRLMTNGAGFGWRVQWARDQARLKQEVLAGRAGIHRTWLARIEAGREPKMADALALYDALVAVLPDLSLSWLLTGQGDRLRAGRVDPDVKRREFNRRLAAILPASTGLPIALDLERLVAHVALDRALVEGCEALADAHASLRLTLPPGELLPMVETHLLSLHRRLAEAAGPPVLRRRLLSIAGMTSVLAAWTCYRLDRRRDARTYLDRAELLAREIDDTDVEVLVLMLRADLASAIPNGGLEGSPLVAKRLLDAALMLASGPARAPLLLRRAEEHAFSGRERESRADIEDAEHAAEAPGRPLGLNEAAPIAPYLGNCLQMLGRPAEAIEVIPLMSTDLPIQLAIQPIMLAACQAQLVNMDGAVELLSRALDVIEEHGLLDRARRVAGVRRIHLARWGSEPAVQMIDERLASIL